MSRGVALKLQNFQDYSAVDIINKHLATARLNDGQVYFSTGLKISCRQGTLSTLILCYRSSNQLGYVQADIVKVLRSPDHSPFIPADAEALSPAEFAHEPQNTWFLIKNLRRPDPQFLANLKVVRVTGEVMDFLQVFDVSPRLNRVYIYDNRTDENDGLIF